MKTARRKELLIALLKQLRAAGDAGARLPVMLDTINRTPSPNANWRFRIGTECSHEELRQVLEFARHHNLARRANPSPYGRGCADWRSILTPAPKNLITAAGVYWLRRWAPQAALELELMLEAA